jgi:transposase
MASHTHYAQVDRLEVVDTGRRRRWSTDEKLKIVAESFAGPRLVSTIARRYGISPSLLFTWRRVFHAGVSARPETKFVPALVMPESRPDDPSPAPAGRVEIVARNGRRLIVDASLDLAAISRLLDLVERR